MSSDEDYMSDKLLGNEDVRPGLIWNRSSKRSLEIAKKVKKKPKPKPLAVVEREKREDGLNRALSSNNKGFKLLQMMGYKPGQSLGKSAEGGRKEPIPINVKNDRGGLGRDAIIQEKKQIIQNQHKLRMQVAKQASEKIQNEFIANSKSKNFLRRHRIDLYKSRRVCENLDRRKGMDSPTTPWFWLEVETEDETEEEEKEEKEEIEEKEEKEEKEEIEEKEFDLLSDSEKLEILTKYLREEHFYCLWCGTSYEDEKDMKLECPGDQADDH